MKIKNRESFNAGIEYAAYMLDSRGYEYFRKIEKADILDRKFLEDVCDFLATKINELQSNSMPIMLRGTEILEFDE